MRPVSLLALAAVTGLAGCVHPSEIGRAPAMSAVGGGSGEPSR